MKKPTKKTLNSIDMIKIMESIPNDDTNFQYIDMKAGEEHYRLLTWIGGQVKGNIMELGTFRGHSALCLSKSGNKVFSYDVQDYISLNDKPENVTFSIMENGHKFIDDSFDLLFIDTMHDGIYEQQVLNHLRDIKWKGIVLMDDILLFDELSKLWEQIPEQKADWTDIGHHSGTGIIWFK